MTTTVLFAKNAATAMRARKARNSASMTAKLHSLAPMCSSETTSAPASSVKTKCPVCGFEDTLYKHQCKVKCSNCKHIINSCADNDV